MVALARTALRLLLALVLILLQAFPFCSSVASASVSQTTVSQAQPKEDFEALLQRRSQEYPSEQPLALKARRNGVPEELDVRIPVPGFGGSWLRVVMKAVAETLRDAPLPHGHPQPEDARLPRQGNLYTGDAIGPLNNAQVSRLRNGTLIVLVGKNRPFVWPAVMGGSRFTSPRAPLVGGKPVELEPVSNSPRIFKLHNLMTEEECAALVRQVGFLKDSDGLQRSTTGGKRAHGGMTVNRIRTSENAFDIDSKIAQRVMRRSFGIIGMSWNVQRADGLQIVRYLPGQAYDYHNDAFPANTRGDGHDYDSSKEGTNRFATVFMYCSTPEEGGQTVFPSATNYSRVEFPSTWAERKDELDPLAKATEMYQPWEFGMVEKCHSNLAVVPKLGDGVLFYSQNIDGRVDDNAQHGGCPVLKGVKWSANLWVWNGPRDGTLHYHSSGVDATIVNQYPARANVTKNGHYLGALEPGEKAPFWVFVGERWRSVDAESGKHLIEWKISVMQLQYVIPSEPDETWVEPPKIVEPEPVASKAPRPKVLFENAARATREIYWVNPANGDETSMGEVGPGDTIEFDSFVGHVFRIRQASGALVKEHKMQDIPFERVRLGEIDSRAEL